MLLYGKTKILLFDEATSALDNETQNLIQKSINNMKGDYTIIIVAHRYPNPPLRGGQIFLLSTLQVLFCQPI